MNDERELERVPAEEAALAHDSEFAIVRKHHSHQVDPQEEIRRANYLRSVEDAVEQNDNSFDGVIINYIRTYLLQPHILIERVINNLPQQTEPDKAESKDKTSVVEEIKRQQEECKCHSAVKPAREFCIQTERRE